MKTIRAFVALNLPLEIIQQAAEVQAELRQAADAAGLRVAWVPAANMHVTLKFLGSIPEEGAQAIADLLRERLAGRPALALDVRGVGAFPERGRPRVLWLGVQSEQDAVAALAADIDGGGRGHRLRRARDRPL